MIDPKSNWVYKPPAQALAISARALPHKGYMGLLFIILTIFIALVFDYTHGRSPGGDRSYRLGLGLYDSGRRFNDGLFFLFGLGRLNSKTIL